MQRAHRAPVARSGELLCGQDSLLVRSLAVVATLVATSDDVVDLAVLPPDLCQILLDHLCFHQAAQAVSARALACFAADASVANCIFRIALRPPDTQSKVNALAWHVDDAFFDTLPRFSSLEVLELGSCFKLTDEPLSRTLRAAPLLRVLDVDRCKLIGDAGLAPIAEGATGRLEELLVGGTRASMIFLALGPRLLKLRTLDACGQRGMTDSALLSLCNCNHLASHTAAGVLPPPLPPPSLLLPMLPPPPPPAPMPTPPSPATTPPPPPAAAAAAVAAAPPAAAAAATAPPPPPLTSQPPPPPALPPPPPLLPVIDLSGLPAPTGPLPLCCLGLASCAISDAGCSALTALGPTLTSLDLSFNPRVTHGVFLCGLPQLTSLDLSLNAWVDDDVAVHLGSSLPRLQRLVLEKTELSDGGVAALSALGPSLTYLDLSRTNVYGTLDSLASLGRMAQLATLLLAYTGVDMALAHHLPPSLRHLKLSRCLLFDDDALRRLADELCAYAPTSVPPSPRASLTALDLGSPGITDAAIPALQMISDAGLLSLTLWHSKMTHLGAARLVAATGLALDMSMNSTEGTFLLHREEEARGSGA